MARYFRRRKFCRFTAEGVKEIDYKDLDVLREYVNETGTIVPRCCPTRTSTADGCPLFGRAEVGQDARRC